MGVTCILHLMKQNSEIWTMAPDFNIILSLQLCNYFNNFLNQQKQLAT